VNIRIAPEELDDRLREHGLPEHVRSDGRARSAGMAKTRRPYAFSVPRCQQPAAGGKLKLWPRSCGHSEPAVSRARAGAG
jgi:hypothetical protein